MNNKLGFANEINIEGIPIMRVHVRKACPKNDGIIYPDNPF